jgi:hypothetical protein
MDREYLNLSLRAALAAHRPAALHQRVADCGLAGGLA